MLLGLQALKEGSGVSRAFRNLRTRTLRGSVFGCGDGLGLHCCGFAGAWACRSRTFLLAWSVDGDGEGEDFGGDSLSFFLFV
jgi:hypothetical protein